MSLPRKSGRRTERFRPVVLAVTVGGVLLALFLAMPSRRDARDTAAAPPVPALDTDGASANAAGQARVAADDAVTTSADAARSARAARIAELAGASQSFRDTTLLLAIQDSGFVCEVVADVVEVGAPVEGWQARCPRGYEYAVVIDEAGELQATPMPGDFDGLAVPAFTEPQE